MKIDTNHQHLNFKGFKINPGVKESLKKQPDFLVKTFLDAADYFKNTKYYDVEIFPDLKCKITSKPDAYFGPIWRGWPNYLSGKLKTNDCLAISTYHHDNWDIPRCYLRKINTPIPEYKLFWNDRGCPPIDDFSYETCIDKITDIIGMLDDKSVELAEEEANKSKMIDKLNVFM